MVKEMREWSSTAHWVVLHTGKNMNLVDFSEEPGLENLNVLNHLISVNSFLRFGWHSTHQAQHFISIYYPPCEFNQESFILFLMNLLFLFFFLLWKGREEETEGRRNSTYCVLFVAGGTGNTLHIHNTFTHCFLSINSSFVYLDF